MEKKERNVTEELDQQENNDFEGYGIKDLYSIDESSNHNNEYDGCDITGLYWVDEDLYPNHEIWPEDPRDQVLD